MKKAEGKLLNSATEACVTSNGLHCVWYRFWWCLFVCLFVLLLFCYSIFFYLPQVTRPFSPSYFSTFRLYHWKLWSPMLWEVILMLFETAIMFGDFSRRNNCLFAFARLSAFKSYKLSVGYVSLAHADLTNA